MLQRHSLSDRKDDLYETPKPGQPVTTEGKEAMPEIKAKPTEQPELNRISWE
jgi:hypothetical protein